MPVVSIMAVRRGKFRAFLKPAPASIKYEEDSFTSSQDDEISVEIAVGPTGKTSINYNELRHCLAELYSETNCYMLCMG